MQIISRKIIHLMFKTFRERGMSPSKGVKFSLQMQDPIKDI